MVNEAFANRFLKGVDPLQQRVVMEQVIPGAPKLGPAIEWQIVGVFHTVKSRGSREDNPEIDTPFWQEAYPRLGYRRPHRGRSGDDDQEHRGGRECR